MPQGLAPVYTGPGQVLGCPVLSENTQPPQIQPAQLAATDQPLPINLPTALYLSNARPLVIAAARTSVEEAVALLQSARVLALPNLNFGTDFYRHTGLDQSTDGTIIRDNKSAFATGGGATLDFGITDAIFVPLVARQNLAAREADLQTARNDALFTVAVAYFDVQQARGSLAGALDSIDKAEVLVRKTTGLAGGLVSRIEIDRARALEFDLQQQVVAARANWRIASSRLTRVLRLNPAAVVVPLEPPHLQIAMISPRLAVADLIPVGLANRPELSSERALVQASEQRVRQERVRPLLPTVVMQGAGPGGYFNGGVFGGGPDGGTHLYGGRFDMEVGAVWTLDNLGLGNRARVHERVAQEQRSCIDLADTQDRVAQEVVEALANLEAADAQVESAKTTVRESVITYNGTLTGIGETRAAGGLLQLINRPQEAVAALQEVKRSYDLYFTAINNYNRAQFQLYRALGYPARILVCDRPVGQPAPIDTSRPPGMAPDCPHMVSRPCP